MSGILPWYVTSHSGQLSLAIPLWVGTMSTVLAMVSATVSEETASSRPCYQDCSHTDLVGRLKALAANRVGHPANIGHTLAGLTLAVSDFI